MSSITGGTISTNLEDNFKEIYKGLSKIDAVVEANRCLYCYDAPCIKACPTSIAIPNFIKKIASSNMLGSAKTILEANPLGASCARVCPTEELCEGACVLNSVSSKPIQIGNLQRYATDWAIAQNKTIFKAGTPNGKTIAIVGSGPAGLAAARELARMGFSVTIFEAEKEPGGLGRYGIVSFRLPREVVEWEVNQVKELGVTIKTSCRVGQDIAVSQLMEDYDRVVLAVGMSSVPKIGIPGEDLEGVLDAIDFVKETKEGTPTESLRGKTVAVIGAGNTAIDAATTAVRLGAANVQIVYRRTKNEMTAYQFEYDFAKQDGVEFKWLTAPVEVLGKDGKVTGLTCVKMKLGEKDEGGRQRPIPVDDSEFVMDVDYVIRAIGQSRYTSLIEAFAVDNQYGVVTVDANMQTSNEKIFACGDLIFGNGQGEAMVVSAVEQGKTVAKSILQSFELQVEIA